MKKLFGFLMSFLLVFSVMTPLTTTSAAELKRYELDFDSMTTESLKGKYNLSTDGAGTRYAIVDNSSDSSVPVGYKKVLKRTYKYGETNEKDMIFSFPDSISGPVKINFSVKVAPSKSVPIEMNGRYCSGLFSSDAGIIVKHQTVALYAGNGDGTSSLTEAGNGKWVDFEIIANTNTQTYGKSCVNMSVQADGKKTWHIGRNMGTNFPNGKSLKQIMMSSTFYGTQAGDVIDVYFDDIIVEEIDPAEMMKLVSSSVKDGDTDVAWAGFIDLNFDREVYPASLAAIKLRQGGNDIKVSAAVDSNDPKRVIISHATLTSNAPCELILPTTVSGKDGMLIEKEQIIHFTPATKFKMDVNFDDMAIDTVYSCNNGYLGLFCMYANHAFELKTESYQNGQLTELKGSKYEILDENGDHYLRVTAVGQGLNNFYLNFNDSKMTVMGPSDDGSIREYSYRFRVSGDTIGTWTPTAVGGGGMCLLKNSGGLFGSGGDDANPTFPYPALNEKTDGVPRYANGEWCTVRYVIEPNKDKATVIVNEGESDEAIYKDVDIGDLANGIAYYRVGPNFTNISADKTLSFDFDDFVAKYVPAPATDTLVLTGATLEGEVKGGSTVTVKGTFANGTAEAQKPQMVAAVYNNDHELLSATIVSQSILSKDTVDVPAQLTIPAEAGEGAYVKVFGFDSFDSLKPLGEAVKPE